MSNVWLRFSLFLGIDFSQQQTVQDRQNTGRMLNETPYASSVNADLCTYNDVTNSALVGDSSPQFISIGGSMAQQRHLPAH